MQREQKRIDYLPRQFQRTSAYQYPNGPQKKKASETPSLSRTLPLAALPQELLADTVDPPLEVVNGTCEVKSWHELGKEE
jgi:hypothetical protein